MTPSALCRRWLLPALAALLSCCSSADVTPTGNELPFSVAVHVLPMETSGAEDDVEVKPYLQQYRVKQALKETGIFTSVVAADDPAKSPPDLTFTVRVRGTSFHAGEPTWIGGSLSTLAWLLAGYAAWFVPDREYASDFFADYWIDAGVDSSGAVDVVGEGMETTLDRLAFFYDAVALNGIQLARWDRRSGGNPWEWLWIFLPPVSQEGEPEASLWEAAEKLIAREVAERLRSRLPASFLAKYDCYVLLTPDRKTLVVVARNLVYEVKITPDDAKRGRSIGLEDIVQTEVARPRSGAREEADALGEAVLGETTDAPGREDKNLGYDELRDFIRSQEPGMGGSPLERYYRIPLHEDETGFLRIDVVLEETQGHFTLFRPAPVR